MSDWRDIVRQRLSGLELDAAERNEVHSELATHLEESYQAFRKQGLSDKEAEQRTLTEVPNWQDLQHRIFDAKRGEHFMQKRMRQLWIPGFLTLILSVLFLAILQKLGFQARIIRSAPNAIFLYVPWLLSLPLLGAFAAWLSSRSGGSRGTVVLASVFPVLALTAALLLMFPIGFVIERIIGSRVNAFGIVATTILRDGIGWILTPGAALLVGGLLMHLLFSRRSSSQDAAID